MGYCERTGQTRNRGILGAVGLLHLASDALGDETIAAVLGVNDPAQKGM
jgi:hypothetical protein